MKFRNSVAAVVAAIIFVLASFVLAVVPGETAYAISPLKSPPPNTTTWICVGATTANIRSGPGTNYKVVGLLWRGQRFNFITISGSWVKGTSSTGKTGWVYRPLLRCWDPRTGREVSEL